MRNLISGQQLSLWKLDISLEHYQMIPGPAKLAQFSKWIRNNTNESTGIV